MIKISPHGGYVTGWSVPDPVENHDTEILYQGQTLKRTGIPPLFPCWGESGTVLRKHGFGRDVEWRVTKTSDYEISMELESANIKEIIKKEYPHAFRATINVKSEKNNLYYSMSVENKGAKPMEIAPAVHPYFKANRIDKNKIKTEGIEGFDASKFDWDNSPPDNHYPFSQFAKIFFMDRTIEIKDISPHPVIKHLVVWSEPVSSPDFNFICFEPVTGLSGAIKRKEITVLPNECWEMKLKFTVSFH